MRLCVIIMFLMRLTLQQQNTKKEIKTKINPPKSPPPLQMPQDRTNPECLQLYNKTKKGINKMLNLCFNCSPFCQCVPIQNLITSLYRAFQIFNIIAYTFPLILGVYALNHLTLLCTIIFVLKQFPLESFIWKIQRKAFHKTYYQAIVNIFWQTEATNASSKISIIVNCLISQMTTVPIQTGKRAKQLNALALEVNITYAVLTDREKLYMVQSTI